MTVDEFATVTALADLPVLERVRLLAFYHHQIAGMKEFTIPLASQWCSDLNLGALNGSRVRSELTASKSFVRGSCAGAFKLHARSIAELTVAHPLLHVRTEVVRDSDSVVPLALVTATRGYVESLARQINVAYEQNLFDACAVLMRRLVEILLIHSYEAQGLAAAVSQPDGSFKNLNAIIDDAETNPSLALSRGTRGCLDVFRALGNFSAHKIHYTAKRADLSKHLMEFRAAVEELLYKANLKK